MITECETIRDLIPLFVDGAASEQSQRLVTKHLTECPECRKYYALVKRTCKDEICRRNLPAVEEKYAVLSKRLKKRRTLNILVAAAVAFCAGLYIVGDVLKSIGKQSRADAVKKTLADKFTGRR